MADRSKLVSQTYIDRAVQSVTKAGYAPEVLIDLFGGTVLVRGTTADGKSVSDWQERAPDRV